MNNKILNNFKKYGFTANFNGEILKKYKMPQSKYVQLVGVILENHTPYVAQWDNDGVCIYIENFGTAADINEYNLIKI